MKKVSITTLLLLVALLAAPVLANACTFFGCYEPPPPIPGSAEAQAFQHQDISYSQDAGVQQINSITIAKTEKDTVSADVSAYGSIHGSPDILFFGDANLTLTKTEVDSLSVTKVCANVNVMDGAFKAAADSGASSTRVGLGEAAANAGNSYNFAQVQNLNYAQGGGGMQSIVASGFTNTAVTAQQ